MKKFLPVLILICFFVCTPVFAQQYDSPLRIPIYLSANFGELRNNHFHSGIDLKTQGVINKPVYSIADGYVSRISVSPGGYGLALYITHPETNHTSVYGHLESFNSEISKYVKAQQYEQESYRVDLYLDENTLPVRKGDFIANSGNTGSSGGPHVHFEIRDTETEEPMDALPFYKNQIEDTTPPDLRGIAIYPVLGEGCVNGSNKPVRQNLEKTTSIKPVTAWGKIGTGVKAYDKMNSTTNIYGVRTVRLFVDGELHFQSVIDRFSFDETRMLNSFVDFEDWRKNKSFFMKSFIEPGNTLPFYLEGKDGYIIIDEEREYKLRYELEDLYGNKTTYSFSIQGKESEIPELPKGSLYMSWDIDNRYISDSFCLTVPKGNLYTDLPFTLITENSERYFSDIFTVHTTPVPFHGRAEMKIKLNTDTLIHKNQYGIVSVNGDKESWVGGEYSENGYLTASIRETGAKYAISSDKVPPTITPQAPEKWKTQGKIQLKVSDNKSGISKIRGTIDGNFALFENDIKSSVYTYHFDSERLVKGQTHELIFTATDACGNTAEYRTEFLY